MKGWGHQPPRQSLHFQEMINVIGHAACDIIQPTSPSHPSGPGILQHGTTFPSRRCNEGRSLFSEHDNLRWVVAGNAKYVVSAVELYAAY